MNKMKKKIYNSLNIISIIAIILCTSLFVLIFYKFQLDGKKESIKEYAVAMSNYMESFDYKSIEDIIDSNSSMRISLINSDGIVLFDSNKEASEMENHINRSEIQKALDTGVGHALRRSSTFEKNTYYYAILLSNNTVLRVSQEIDNVLAVFLNILPAILLIFGLIFIISSSFSSLLSSKILQPINNITDNMENLLTKSELDTLDIYDELLPFVKTLVKQSEKINLQFKDIKERAYIMEVIMSNMNEGLVLVDNHKRILSINKSGIELLEANDGILYIEKSFISLCRDIEINDAINKVLESDKSHEFIHQLHEKYIYFLISPVHIESRSFGAVILMVDYTEKHKAELIRREFSANVSHELKTPLTSINGYAEMIENGMAKGDDIKRFASIIKKEGTRLLDLIDDIIRLSKIEEEGQQKEFQTINIFSIGKDILEDLIFLANEKNIKLNIKGNSTTIKGNESMVKDLIYNLLDNAIKYTNEGGFVTLEIENQSSNVILKVKDTGIGIPYEHQDRIFERFYMVDKSRSKKTKSTGLGLSIVKHIVEYHNGTISLNSIPTKGTEIIIQFKKD